MVYPAETSKCTWSFFSLHLPNDLAAWLKQMWNFALVFSLLFCERAVVTCCNHAWKTPLIEKDLLRANLISNHPHLWLALIHRDPRRLRQVIVCLSSPCLHNKWTWRWNMNIYYKYVFNANVSHNSKQIYLDTRFLWFTKIQQYSNS